MSLLTDMVSRLTADASVAALVGSRVRVNRSAQGDALPRIVITQVSGDHEHHLTGASGFVQGRIQIDCHAVYPYLADNLSEAVRQSLDGFNGLMGSTPVSTMHLSEERTISTPPNPGGGDAEGVETNQTDYTVGWTVSIPTFN